MLEANPPAENRLEFGNMSTCLKRNSIEKKKKKKKKDEENSDVTQRSVRHATLHQREQYSVRAAFRKTTRARQHKYHGSTQTLQKGKRSHTTLSIH